MTIKTAQSARAKKYLQKPVKYKGKVMTRQAWLDELSERMTSLDVVGVADQPARDKAAKTMMLMKREGVPDGNELHPKTIRFRALERLAWEASKSEYRAYIEEDTFLRLTKTEFDYLNTKEHNVG